jgi:hypothetical protein
MNMQERKEEGMGRREIRVKGREGKGRRNGQERKGEGMGMRERKNEGT